LRSFGDLNKRLVVQDAFDYYRIDIVWFMALFRNPLPIAFIADGLGS
jgi:hypothetical protein